MVVVKYFIFIKILIQIYKQYIIDYINLLFQLYLKYLNFLSKIYIQIINVYSEYTQIKELGQGSFGKVFLCKSVKNGQLVAVKEINYSKFSSKEKELLCNEVNITKDLHHPNIVKYYDKIIDKTKEYCDNSDLAHYIKRHKSERRYIAEDKIWSVAYQLLSALDYCHRTAKPGSKVIHRDLKPANVAIMKDGSIKILDFGMASLTDSQTYRRTCCGTPLYQAPSLLDHKQYNEKVDIWAAFCILYELASLQPPYVATNIESLKLKVRAGTRPALPNQGLCQSDEMRPSAQQLLMNSKLVEMAERLTPTPAQIQNVVVPVESLDDKQDRLAKKEMELSLREQKIQKIEAELKKYGCF